MLKQIIKIRVKQFFRVAAEAGFFRAVFLLAMICFGLLAMFLKLEDKSYQEIIIVVVAISILSIHLKRKDREFINIYSTKPYFIFLTEYILLGLPLLGALIYYGFWTYVLYFSLLLALIPFLQINTRATNINSWFQRIIPDNNFEWKAGIRKNLFLFVGIWFLGLVMSFIIASVPVAIFVLGVFVLSFYEKPEPLQILLVNELGVTKFILKKIKNHLMIFAATTTPLVLAFLIFHPHYYFIPFIEMMMFSFLIAYSILLKYAFYRPENSSAVTGIFSMIGIISVFIPVFFPVVLVLSVKFLVQATNNLKFYLNDFN